MAPCARPRIAARGLEGAQVIYAKEWGATANYGDAESDARLRASLTDWCVRDSWFQTTDPACKLMHCLPVRRNTAIADEVLDGPRQHRGCARPTTA